MNTIVYPSKFHGAICAVPSKSEAIRHIICNAISGGSVDSLPYVGESDDVIAALRCVLALCTGGVLDCGECGAVLRFLLPVASALGGASFCGRGKLPLRPVVELIKALSEHGAVFTADKLPLSVSGTLRGGDFVVPGDVSSQYVSGLLLAMPLLEEKSKIVLTSKLESRGYVDMTRKVMACYGVEITNDLRYDGKAKYTIAKTVQIEGDWSSASFFLCAGAISGEITITGLSAESLQGDKKIASILRDFGANVSQTPYSVSVSSASLHGIEIDMCDIPDLLPVLAVTGAFAEGKTILYNASRTRLKECDRLHASAVMLASLGVKAEEKEDALIVHGGTIRGGIVDSFGDHRMVMAGAIALASGKTEGTIIDGSAVSKSYPNFFCDFEKLGGKYIVV